MQTIQQTQVHPFLEGGGEMSTLTRNFDWSQTSIGTPDRWPQSLRATVSNLLRSKFPMFLWWGEEMLQFYNDAYRPSLGNEGKHPFALGAKGVDTWPEIWDIISPLHQKVENTGEATWMENQLVPIYRNGKIEDVYWTYSYSSVLDDDGAHAGILVTCMETTEAFVANQRIERSHQELLQLFEESPVAIARISKDEHLVFEYVNSLYCVLVGRKPEDIIGKPLLQALPEIAEQGFDNLLKEVIRTGNPFVANEVAVDILRDENMETIFLNLAYQPRTETDGSIGGVLVVATDVTEQVRARKIIEESEEKYHSLFESMDQGYCTLEVIFEEDRCVDYRYLETNPSFERQSGLMSATGKTIRELTPDIETKWFEFYGNVSLTGTPIRIEEESKALNKWFEVYAIKVGRAEERKVGVFFTDITERKKSEGAIRESETRFRTLADDSPMFVFILDVDPLAPVAYWNKTWLSYTGQSHEEAVGRAWSDIIHPDDIPVVMEYYGAAFEKKEAYYISAVRVKRYDGAYRWHAFKGNPRFADTGKFDGYIGVGFDVHEQKITEENLETLVAQRTQDLQQVNTELKRSNANLEEFAHAASHDLKEPVRKIHFFTTQLKEQLSTQLKEGQARAFDRIENAVERMGNLIDDLLLYSHVSQRPHQTEPVDLDEKIQRVLDDLELDIEDKKATIEVKSLPVVKGYRRQLQQLFQNLISNAVKYSKEDAAPKIIISADQAERHGRQYHRIKVADNGIGFEPQYKDKIFQMFTRLHGKSEYSGTGVGLSIVKKVVENHDGYIDVESQPGEGSTFNIYLPV